MNADEKGEINVERFFCNGKKNFCDDITKCGKCEFKDGTGVVGEESVKKFLSCLFGENYNLDRLRELAQADRDGRCVVLPCKAGDIVYSMFPFCGVNSHEIRRIEISKEGCFACSALMIPFSDFGKTVFLTREAAEEAMKERENNG